MAKIRVKVLFFGATADSAGRRQLELEFAGEVSATRALEKIFVAVPDIVSRHDRNSLHFSINQEYAQDGDIIRDGDELAVFTAVSGG